MISDTDTFEPNRCHDEKAKGQKTVIANPAKQGVANPPHEIATVAALLRNDDF